MRGRLRRVIALACVAASTAVPARGEECQASGRLSFRAPVVVDAYRPGADPAIVRHPSGVLILTAQPFVQRTEDEPDAGYMSSISGHAPVWTSLDDGGSWTRSSLRAGAGVADPDLAVDAGGTVYLEERNGLTTAVSRSSDAAAVWVPRAPAATTQSDRPWLGADGPGVVYLSADQSSRRNLYRSADGGLTFDKVAEIPGGFSRPVVAPSGAVHAAFTRFGAGPQPGQMIAVASYPNARSGDFAMRIKKILEGRENFDQETAAVDAAGNVYVAWTQRPTLVYPGGVWYAYSTDGGTTFSAPIRLDRDNASLDLTVAMPVIAAAGGGHVAVAWLQSSRSYRKDDPASWPEALWRVRVASSSDATGCGGAPHWAQATATGPVHRGPMCAGTLCDLGSRNDSRMGRFLAATTTASGRLVIAYPDSTMADPGDGGPSAVAHPAVVVSNETL